MDWSVSRERRNLVSARVPSHFNWPLLDGEWQAPTARRTTPGKSASCNPLKRRPGGFPSEKEMYLALAGNRTTIARTSSPKPSHYTRFPKSTSKIIQETERSGLIWLRIWNKGFLWSIESIMKITFRDLRLYNVVKFLQTFLWVGKLLPVFPTYLYILYQFIRRQIAISKVMGASGMMEMIVII